MQINHISFGGHSVRLLVYDFYYRVYFFRILVAVLDAFHFEMRDIDQSLVFQAVVSENTATVFTAHAVAVDEVGSSIPLANETESSLIYANVVKNIIPSLRECLNRRVSVWYILVKILV